MNTFNPETCSRAELDEITLAWRQAKADRLAFQKQLELLQELENTLKQSILDVCTAQKMEGIVVGGRITSVTTKSTPICNDQSALSAYILEHQALDLLQFRISTKAAQLRIDDGIELPGVTLMDKLELSDKKA